MKASEIRELNDEERAELLNELTTELMHERGVAAMGGAPPNPGRLSAIRRDIARIKTIDRENEIARGDR